MQKHGVSLCPVVFLNLKLIFKVPSFILFPRDLARNSCSVLQAVLIPAISQPSFIWVITVHFWRATCHIESHCLLWCSHGGLD